MTPETALTPDKWFATPIWSRTVSTAAALNPQLLQVHAAIKAEGNALQRSNVGGWHSHDKVHLREDMTTFRTIVRSAALGCAQHLGFNFENHDLFIKEMWFNENGPGHFNRTHIHPGAMLSGAYYVQVPEDGGNIEFLDPILARQTGAFPARTKDRRNAGVIEYPATEGGLLLFPGWIQHGVQPNRGTSPRVSISFNIAYRPIAPR